MTGHTTWQHKLGKAALEIAGIVFAVLLALWLEGWRDDAELQARADDALVRIRAEITSNRADVADSNRQNLANMDGIRKAIAAGPADIDRLAAFMAISSASINDSAWTSTKMTDVLAKMPVETVGKLAALYDTQTYFTDYARYFMGQYTDLTVEIQRGPDADKAALKFAQHLGILASLGAQLIEAYDEFLRIPATGS